MPTILIADDELDLRVLIRESLALSDSSYDFLEARNGVSGLEIAREHKPDLILLDIIMPGMDGIEMCRHLKSDPETKHIPVIFLTALKDSEEKIKGVGVGGDDFLVKPFMPLELVLRVRSLLRIKLLHDEVQSQYDALQEAHAELQRLGQLKDDLTNMIIHDMRTPLSSTQLGLQFVLMDNPGLSDAHRNALDVALGSVTQLTKMVTNLLDISRMEEGKLELDLQPVDVGAIAGERARELDAFAKVDGKTFSVELEPDLPSARADVELISRVIGNLMDNALHYAAAGSGILFTAAADDAKSRLLVSVHNEGEPIPAEMQEAIFEKFRQGDAGVAHGGGVGLGLAFCKMAVEAHGGEIWVNSEPGMGTTFTFWLPTS